MVQTLCAQLVATPGCNSSSTANRRSLQCSSGRLAGSAAAAAAARQHPQQRQQPARRRRGSACAAVVDNDEDLWQYADREAWYQAKWCAADQPDWNPARFVRSTQLAPGVREVVVECEVSREKVPLRNAYKHVGQRASVRINSGVSYEVSPTVPPPPQLLNQKALLRVRGDILAGETKTVKEEISVLVEMPLYVREEEAAELYKMTDEDAVEVGPFMGGGMQLRGPIAGVFLYPTVVIFVEGAGIAAAKALIEAGTQPEGLSLTRRQDVRMYYRAPNEASLSYKDKYEEWGERYNVQVTTSTRDTFSEMFDDDQTLMYDPDTTAAIILCGSDEEAEAAALEACREAEISVVLKQSEDAPRTEYLKYGKPNE